MKEGKAMKRSFSRPKWFILYLLTFLYLGAFWMAMQSGSTESGLIWAEAGLTCAYFGLVLSWLNANEYAMWLEDQEKREASRQSTIFAPGRRPHGSQRPVSGDNGNISPEPSFVGRFSRWIPAWVVTLISQLGGTFKGLH
jgi:hypothetical protein